MILDEIKLIDSDLIGKNISTKKVNAKISF